MMNMSGESSIFKAVCGLVIMLACAAASAQDIEGQQAAWESLAVENYHLIVQDVAVWRILTVELWVEGSRVKRLRASCERGLILTTCSLDTIIPRHYTIDGLFEAAQASGASLARIEFDADYHFPQQVSFDNPQAVDDERALRVLQFEPLEALPAASIMATPTSAAPAPTEAIQREIVRLNSQVVQEDLVDAIERGEETWAALGVASYELQLTETGVWSAMRLAITVQDGRAVSLVAECDMGWMRGPCSLWPLETSQYTIHGLFERARQAADADWGSHEVLALDTTTGIPLMIFYDEERTADEAWQLTVTALTLPEPQTTLSQP